MGYAHKSVETRETSGGWSFSVDVLGIGRMAELLPPSVLNHKSGATSSIAIPFEASVERDGDKTSFFVPSGGLDAISRSTEAIGDHVAGVWSNTCRLTDQVFQHPTDKVIELMTPLQTAVDELASKLDSPTRSSINPLDDPTSSIYGVELDTPPEPLDLSQGLTSLIYGNLFRKMKLIKEPELRLAEKTVAERHAVGRTLKMGGVNPDLVDDITEGLMTNTATVEDLDFDYLDTRRAVENQRGRSAVRNNKETSQVITTYWGKI